MDLIPPYLLSTAFGEQYKHLLTQHQRLAAGTAPAPATATTPSLSSAASSSAAIPENGGPSTANSKLRGSFSDAVCTTSCKETLVYWGYSGGGF